MTLKPAVRSPGEGSSNRFASKPLVRRKKRYIDRIQNRAWNRRQPESGRRKSASNQTAWTEAALANFCMISPRVAPVKQSRKKWVTIRS